MGGRGFKRFGFAVLLLVLSSAPTLAGGAEAFASMGSVAAASTESNVRLAAHFRKVQSFYCYPKNYWWFYRPYTTASQGYARCMPYFHYLDEASPSGRSGKPDREFK